MKLIIAGSRTLSPSVIDIADVITKSGFVPDLLICGCAHGVDRAGFKWARYAGIKVEFFPAWNFQRQWAEQMAKSGEFIHKCPPPGFGAGFARNREMVHLADAAILFWDGISRGTAHTKNLMELKKLPLFIERTVTKPQ